MREPPELLAARNDDGSVDVIREAAVPSKEHHEDEEQLSQRFPHP